MKKLFILTMLVFASVLFVACDGATTTEEATEAPTTQAPTTQAPTTQAPTTEAPTTQAPTTQAPTTEAPTTVAPTTETPTTAAPDTTDPVFFGLDDRVLYFGDTFDPTLGVIAMDDTDGPLTSSVTITGTVDLETEGVYELTYSVTDAAGNTATEMRTITVYASKWIIPNSDFDEDVANTALRAEPMDWNWKSNLGGEITGEISDGMAKIEIINAGTGFYGVQFYLLNRTVEQGKTYRITFRVKADAERPLQVNLENGTGGFKEFENIYDLTTDWQEVTFDHYQFNNTIDNAKFAFFAGNINASTVATTIYFDYVRVEEIDNEIDTEAPELFGVGPVEVLVGDTFDPLEGVTFTENLDYMLTLDDLVVTGDDAVDTSTVGEYTVVYTLTDATGNETVVNRTVKVVTEIMNSSLMVENGDFSKNQLVPYSQPAVDGWGWHGSGSFLNYILDGVATIDVYDTWRLFYGTQFYQQNRVLTEGQVYQITFMAKADEPRLLQVQFEASGMATHAAVFELTTDWQTFTYEYAHNTETKSNVKFGFFAGNVHGVSAPTKVYLDDIDINVISEMSDDTTAPQIWGVEEYNVVVGNAFDPLMGIEVNDHYDNTLTVDDIVITSDVDTDVIGAYTVTYTLSDISGNEAVYTRTVNVIAEVDAAETRINFIDGDFEAEATITDSDSNQGWTLKGNGGYDDAVFVADRGGKVVKVNVTNVGTIPHSVQFHQMNQPGFLSEFGAMYKFTFWAKADAARDIAVQLQENSGWKVLANETVSITTDWAQYEVIMVNDVRTYDKVKLGFFFGLINAAEDGTPSNSVATAVYLDDVEIQLIGYVNDEVAPRINAPDTSVAVDASFDPLSGIRTGDATKMPELLVTGSIVTYDAGTDTYTVDTSVAGTYTLTYTLTDMYGNETIYDRTLDVTDGTETSSFVVVNGDFTVPQADPYGQPAELGWGWHGSGSFLTNIEAGIATVDVYDTWRLFYGTQFYEQNRTLTQGETYLFSFSAKADEPRLLQVNLESGSMSNVTKIFELSTDWQTFTFEYHHTSATITNVAFKFFAGNIQGVSAPTTVYLDDVVVDRIFGLSADTEAPQIWGVEEYNVIVGNDFDPLTGLDVWDNQDSSLEVEHIVVESSDVDTDTVGTYTVTYSVTDSSKNTSAIYTRTVNVIAEVDAADTRIDFIDSDFEAEATITDSDSNQGWTLKGNGGYDAATFVDGRGGKVVKVNVTDVGTIPHSVQFHQMNQDGFVSEFGAIYKFSFWAKADAARDIAVQLQENGGWRVLTNETVSITTDWVQYEVILVNNEKTYDRVKLGFFFGLIDSENPSKSVATAVYLDDVEIQLIGYVNDEVAPRIYAPDMTIAANDVFDPEAGIKFGDATKLPELVITGSIVTYDALADTYTVDTTTAGTYTITYTLTDMYGNELVYNRELIIT